MTDKNDLPVNEKSVKISFLTNPRAVDHQELHDGNSILTQRTSSNPVCKIRTKRRTSIDRCPSILALVQTFLHMIIALAIILVGSPVLVAGIGITERVTLQAGKPGVVPFHLTLRPSDTFQVSYYTLRIESNTHPFCINGEVDIVGFKNPSQLQRFSTSVTDLDTSPCVNLTIDNVDTLDEDGYILTAVWHSFENVRYETVKKEICVQTSPGPAKCFITLSENGDYPYEVHCRATTGSVTTTLSCYQTDQMIDVKIDITDNGLITRGICLLPDDTHFSCCSHDVTSYVSAKMCNDFEWPHGKETTRQTVKSVPTSVTTPTPQTESHTESGTCRQFMLPSLWHFTYLFINLLAFVTIY
ncbi:uncharacterized protein LOC105446377 [Strongylocentrotus purpuratus]|uniref:Uncharacterized protein n=1 Tax=Strongylocentrotus purpuratus TaxID=7668 RepID=A0A7M7HQ41_STRPU|nr:uncharacterized protein LOC105446377 [Strongylocentrotus purpuratus]|eukprot:XP_011681425.1 PREDICTED: uncharacterized protein LOC105446377 [Strongylocentrotus purpuratus]